MPRFDGGFISVPREFFRAVKQENPFYGDGALLLVYLALGARANWRDGETKLARQMMTLKRGQLVLGQRELAEDLGLGRQVVRRCLSTLDQNGKINQQTNPHGTIVTIVDYDEDFGKPEEANPPSNPRPTHGQPHLEPGNQGTRETHTSPSAPAGAPDQEKDELLQAMHDGTAEPEMLEFIREHYPAEMTKPAKVPRTKRLRALPLHEIWNEHCGPCLPKVTELSKGRQRKMADRTQEKPDASYWEETVKRLEKSTFATSRIWCTFDWLIKNSENHLKASAGYYDDKPVGKPRPKHLIPLDGGCDG